MLNVIPNTGTESILNWAIAYRAGGEVNGLWNAVSPKENIIKNAGYNYEIKPDGSVSFGYTLSGENLELPKEFEIVSKRTNVTDGYEVQFDVFDDWGDGFQGAVTVTNTGSEPLEAWTLTFDANFTIGDYWGGRIIDSSENSYTIASELWTNPIMPNSSSSFGFTAAKQADTEASANNFVLTSVKIDENTITEDIDYELDSDEDGLPDYYEDIIGTDKNNTDTDGDGLSDGYEVLYLGTDPLKADSDDNGINDGDEDFDNDGLTNAKECELGTEPNTADTDGDGLNDGAEVNTHSTDPLKYDTDGDGISDGDEITLGLNPNSAATDGTPDSERTFTQIVSSDSEVLSAVNNDNDTPFKVSLEMKSAGVAENNVYARESGYSNAIENSAIIGIAPEFVYTDGLAVEEVTVKFELENSIIGNTLGTYAVGNDGFKGIKRLTVFMFFDDINMLLPVETNYDEANNVVYTTTDRVGTYCLMDMELFFQNLGIEPSQSAESEVSKAMFQNSLDFDTYLSYNFNSEKTVDFNTANIEAKNDFDVVFVIDEINYTDEQLKDICDKISDTSKAIFNASNKYVNPFNPYEEPAKNVTVSIYIMDGKGRNCSSFLGSADSIDGINSILKKVSHVEISGDEEVELNAKSVVSKTIDYITLSYLISSIYRCGKGDLIDLNANYENGYGAIADLANNDPDVNFDHEEYCFFFFDNNNTFCSDGSKSTLFDINNNEYNIKFSVVSDMDGIDENGEHKYSYFCRLYGETGGKAFGFRQNREVFVEDVLRYIYGEVPATSGAYNAIIATGYSTVVLDKPITQKYIDNAYNSWLGGYEFDEEELEDCADTDGDGLWDFEEILFFTYKQQPSVITVNDDGTVNLPIIDEILHGGKLEGSSYLKKFPVPAYVESGRDKALEQYDNCYCEFLSFPVLPIRSDPTKKDSDCDGLADNDDPAKLNNEFTGILVDSSCGIKNANVEFKVDFNLFFKDETKYNKDLSTIASLLSHDVYDNRYVKVNDLPLKTSKQDSPLNMALLFGLQDVKDIVIYNPTAKYSETSETGNNIIVYDDDVTEFVIGHYRVEKGSETREVIVIIVRGTNGTIEEWSSNFDVGADTDEYYTATGQHSMWKHKENHKGFDVTANRALNEIEKYMDKEFIDKGSDISFFVTGHSRGAAVANLIAKDLADKSENNSNKVFGYTFAAPNNTTSKEYDNSKYNSIFNIVNVDDLIPCLPLDDWGFHKYGVLKEFSIKDKCEVNWETLSGFLDYNSNGNFDDTLNTFGKIIDTSGDLSRNDLYTFTGNDDEYISFNILNYIDDQTAIDEFKKMYGERMAQYCRIRIVDKPTSIFDPTEHKAIIQQAPAFLMMDLVYITVSKDRGGKVHGYFGCDVAKKYENAKWEFIYSGVDSIDHGKVPFGGMTHPHLPMSYYLISTKLT